MRNLTSLVLAVAATAAASSAMATSARVLLQCNNEMWNVAVLSKAKGAKEVVTVSMSDVGGHGKDYVTVIARGTLSSALANGLILNSDQDDLGRPTGAITGTEILHVSGNVAELTGELPAQVQCVDLQIDNIDRHDQ